jgi:hypothetical protein
MVGDIISERWAELSRNGGRLHSGMVGDFERNPQNTFWPGVWLWPDASFAGKSLAWIKSPNALVTVRPVLSALPLLDMRVCLQLATVG